jgi:hypothetical protein
MSAASVKLLQAAAGIAGGTKELAERLGIRESLLEKFLDGTMLLPDPLLLQAVDVVLGSRQPPLPGEVSPAACAAGGPALDSGA